MHHLALKQCISHVIMLYSAALSPIYFSVLYVSHMESVGVACTVYLGFGSIRVFFLKWVVSYN